VKPGKPGRKITIFFYAFRLNKINQLKFRTNLNNADLYIYKYVNNYIETDTNIRQHCEIISIFVSALALIKRLPDENSIL